MAEKVKLTQEQADELELQKKELQKKDIVIRRVLTADNNGYFNTTFHSISVDKLIKALYIGYEVDPKYNAGDWLKNTTNQQVFKLDDGAAKILNEFPERYNYIRHATAEEIAEEKKCIWWGMFGREVYEFKKGDLIKCEGITSEVEELKEGLIWIKLNKSKGTLTKELYHQIKVICFVEDRKDLECEEV